MKGVSKGLMLVIIELNDSLLPFESYVSKVFSLLPRGRLNLTSYNFLQAQTISWPQWGLPRSWAFTVRSGLRSL